MTSPNNGKFSVRGLSWDTTEEMVRNYFRTYGNISHSVIVRDCYAFLVFSNPINVDSIMLQTHTIDGRNVVVRRASSSEEQHAGNLIFAQEGGYIRTNKIFVGGLPHSLTEEEFRRYFENYGHVRNAFIKRQWNTHRGRGFGFVLFYSEDAVDRVLHKTFHELKGTLVEVKRQPKNYRNQGGGAQSRGNQGYGANTNVFGSRMEGSRYMWPQSAAGESSAPFGVVHGVATSGMGFGVGAYGSVNPGFYGPARTYIEPGAYNFGYGGAGRGESRNTWTNQSPSDYGVSGFGAAGPSGTPGELRNTWNNQSFFDGVSRYGDAGLWGAPGGSRVGSDPVGQNPTSTSGPGENDGPSTEGYGAAGPSGAPGELRNTWNNQGFFDGVSRYGDAGLWGAPGGSRVGSDPVGQNPTSTSGPGENDGLSTEGYGAAGGTQTSGNVDG